MASPSSRTNSRPLVGLLVFALLAAATGLGCNKKKEAEAGAGAAPSGSYHFAFVTNNSSDFWNIGEKGLRKAEKELGVKVDMFRPLKGEVADQQRFLEDILVQGFDGVVISPINPDAMTDLFARVAAKMPLVTTDSDAPKSARKVYVGTNNVEAGKVAGNTAVAALKAAGVTKGKVALFVGRMDMQNAIERKQGIDATLGKTPGIEILPVFLDHADRALAKKNVEDALARYPDLVLAMGIWSYNGPCMADAVRASSRKEKPILVVFDEEEETLKAVRDGLISATIVQRPFQFGYQSVKALKELRDGKTLPPFIDTGILVVDKKNLDQFWNELRELKK
ncbi:MAG TPA: sugar-binding protein [Polyangia bacterium]|nr:sugar-binding protein [Polyangia bacterium]